VLPDQIRPFDRILNQRPDPQSHKNHLQGASPELGPPQVKNAPLAQVVQALLFYCGLETGSSQYWTCSPVIQMDWVL